MSILSELKKLTGKQNAKVVSEALPPVLPVPEDGDSGKVPIVQSDGSYALGNASGKIVIATFTTDKTSGTISSDKTYSELYSAFFAGKTIICFDQNNSVYYPFSSLSEVYSHITFLGRIGMDGIWGGYYINSNNVVTPFSVG